MRLTTIPALAGSLVLAFTSIAAATPPSAVVAPAVHATPPPSSAHATGTIARYVISPMGHVRGLALDNGAIVFLHGRGVDALPRQLPVGHAVSVDGERTAASPATFVHASLSDGAGHVYLAATPARAIGVGPATATAAPRSHVAGRYVARLERLPAFRENSTIGTVMTNRAGKVYGLLLSDGASVVVNRRMANALRGHTLARGQHVAIEGRGGAFANGRSIYAEHMTLADGATVNAPLPASPAR